MLLSYILVTFAPEYENVYEKTVLDNCIYAADDCVGSE